MLPLSDSDVFAVVGLGATGLSCIDYLLALKKQVIVFDTRQNPPNLDALTLKYPHLSFHLGELDVRLLDQATHIVLSPGVAKATPAIAKLASQGKPIWGDIELFAQAVRAPVVAITGTNAKSTVTSMVGKMAEAAGLRTIVAGNIGVPVLSLLDKEAPDVYVLELSSFQLETTHSLQPAVACVLNVSPDHLDRYPSLQAYQQAKLNIYQDASRVVFNRDDRLTYVDHISSSSFGLSAPKENEFGILTQAGTNHLAFGETLLLPVTELSQQGRHDQINALAALAIGHAYGLPFAPMLGVLKNFQGLPHRCQLVRQHQGVRWYNDSKGTNVGATVAAIEGLGASLNKQIVLIAGGVGKGADFAPLADSVRQYVKHIVLIGESAGVLHDVLSESAPCSFAKTMEDAVSASSALAEAGDSVLLSPACASFDMFDHYGHRGQVFTDIVNQLS